MKKALIAALVVIILGLAAYFSKNYRMSGATANENTLISIGVLKSNSVDILTGEGIQTISGAEEIKSEEVQIVDNNDLGYYKTTNIREISYLNGHTKFDYVCTFPPVDGKINSQKLGEIECSNGQILSYSLSPNAFQGSQEDIDASRGPNDLMIIFNHNSKVEGLYHPVYRRADGMSNLRNEALYFKGNYMLDQQRNGVSDCFSSTEKWYSLKTNKVDVEIKQGGCTGAHEFVVNKGKEKFEIVPIALDQKEVKGDNSCKLQYTLKGFSIKKNGDIVQNIDLMEPKIFCLGEGGMIGATGFFDPDNQQINVNMYDVGYDLIISTNDLSYSTNIQTSN